MEMNLGKFGATRQSWSREGIRKIYMEIKEENSRAGHTRLVELLSERMREDDDALRAAADYVVTNCELAQQGYGKRSGSRPRPQRKPEEIEQEKLEFIKRVQNIKNQMLLLNLEMPNGKRMRYCTGEEMGKFGAGYTRIAKKVGKTKMVGSMLNEHEVRELMS